MNRVTASASARLLQCSGHARLPWVRSSSAAAENGNRCHKLMETNDHEQDPQTAAAHAAWTAWLDANGFRAPGACQKEWAMALDMETRRVRPIGNGEHRDYSMATPTELCGTADVCGHIGEGLGRHPFVLDWKFGQEPVDADSAQMRTLAVMLGRMEPEQPAAVWCIVVQSPPEGHAVVRARLVEWDDLTAHADMLAHAWNEAREAHMLQRGAECKYCPAAASCPAQLSAMGAIVGVQGPGPITLERAGQIWAEAKQAKKRLEAIEDECRRLAEEAGGLPLPGGKRLVVVQRTRASMDTKSLEAIAREHGATDAEVESCRKVTSYTTTQEVKA